MDTFSVGSILGRLLFSYLVVWLVAFVVCKLRYQRSVKFLHSAKGFVVVATAFALPFLAQIAGRF